MTEIRVLCSASNGLLARFCRCWISARCVPAWILLRITCTGGACPMSHRYLFDLCGNFQFLILCFAYRSVFFCSHRHFHGFQCDNFYLFCTFLLDASGFYCRAGSLVPIPCPMQSYCPLFGTSSPTPCNLTQYAWPGSSACSDSVPLLGTPIADHQTDQPDTRATSYDVACPCACVDICCTQSTKSSHWQVTETVLGKMDSVLQQVLIIQAA